MNPASVVSCTCTLLQSVPWQSGVIGLACAKCACFADGLQRLIESWDLETRARTHASLISVSLQASIPWISNLLACRTLLQQVPATAKPDGDETAKPAKSRKAPRVQATRNEAAKKARK